MVNVLLIMSEREGESVRALQREEGKVAKDYGRGEMGEALV